MSKKLAKYLEILKINYFNANLTFVNTLARALIVIFRVWIFTQLYETTYKTVNQHTIGNLNVPMVLWSLMFAQALYAVPGWGTNKQIEDEIKSGQIAYTLGKPYSYIFFNYASFLGKVVNPFITSLAVGSAATLFFIGPIHITPTSLIASLFQAFLGLTIWFGLSLNLGMLSFWIEDTSAFRWILSKSIMILGGMIIPVSLFPDYLKNITKILPFNYMTAAPAQTFVNYSATESLTIILMQLLWISVFLLSAGLLVQRGGKYVSINGG